MEYYGEEREKEESMEVVEEKHEKFTANTDTKLD